MNHNWIQSAVMGFVCGFCEPMPLSADAHRGLLRNLFGISCDGPLFLLLSHAAVLVVVLMAGGLDLKRLRRAFRLSRTPARRRSAEPDLLSLNTLKFLRGAALFVVVARMLAVRLESIADRLYLLPVFLTAGGLLQWLPALTRSGNKDARNMDKNDGMLMGAAAALSAVPGISLVGACASVGAMRGVSRRYAVRFAWIMLVISLCTGIALDALTLIGAGFEFEMMELLCAAVGAVCAAAGAYLAIRLMQALVRSAGISGFSYYHWGLALLCLVLFLIV